MNILNAAAQLRPGTSWVLRGDVLEQADDNSPRVDVPTLEEINAVIANDPLAYREKRSGEYPPLGDGLDALVHKEDGDSTIWVAYVAACNAVKAKYPKPS